MWHRDTRGSGRVEHWRIDNALDPSGQGYAVDDCIPFEFTEPGAGTPASRSIFNTNYKLFEFAHNTTRYLQSSAQLPHSYKNGTEMRWHVHFVSDSVIPANTRVQFGIDFSYAVFGGVFTAPVTYYATFGPKAADTPAGTHCVTDSGGGLTYPAMVGSGFLLGRIWRNNGVASNAGVPVFFLGSDYHIEKNRIGSATDNPSA